jgi:hypothetical protein
MGGIQFDEDGDTAFRRTGGIKPENALVKSGIVKNATTSSLLLLVVALVLVVGIFYFLKNSLPAPVELGPDVPRKGEVIPSNRQL